MSRWLPVRRGRARRPPPRRPPLLSLAVLATGVLLLLAGWATDREGNYGPNLLLQFGSTLLLVAPLYWVERQLQSRVAALSDEVGAINDRLLRFVGGAPQPVERAVTTAVAGFAERLAALGLPTPAEPPQVVVSDRGEQHYDPLLNVIEVPAEVSDHLNAVLVQYAHPVLMSLPGRGQADLRAAGRSVEEGLAWYLGCAFADDPVYRHPWRGDVDLRAPTPFPRDHPAGRGYSYDRVRAVSAAWASAFWAGGALIEAQRWQAVLVSAWASAPLQARGEICVPFVRALLKDTRVGAGRDAISALLQARGVPL